LVTQIAIATAGHFYRVRMRQDTLKMSGKKKKKDKKKSSGALVRLLNQSSVLIISLAITATHP